jgi:hypothetical protein
MPSADNDAPTSYHVSECTAVYVTPVTGLLSSFFQPQPSNNRYFSLVRARIGVAGSGTGLQTGRMRFDSLELFIYIILPAALWSYHRVGLTTSPPSRASCLEIWEPQPTGALRARTGIASRFTFLIQASEGEFLVNEPLRLLTNSSRYKHCSKARISVFMLAFLFIFIFKFPFTWRPLIFETLCVWAWCYKQNNITTAENRVRSKTSPCAAWSIKWQMDRFSSQVIWLNVKYHSTDEPHSVISLLTLLLIWSK